MTKIAVFGAGTWGIALARLLAVNGRDVTVWSAIPAELKSLSTTRRHPNLPGMELPSAMHYTADIAEACTGRDILLFAVPSPFVRSTAKKAAKYIPDGQLIVDVAKGVEDKTLMTMSEIIEDELAKAKRTARVVALSGPTHAEEVARDMPTLIVAASADEAAAKAVQKAFTAPSFRVYTNTDRRGTELGGAVKNVIALAVGIALGLGYGDNAKAALITRGNAELTRLGLPAGFAPWLTGATAEESHARVAEFERTFRDAVRDSVTARMAGVAPAEPVPTPAFDRESLRGMSPGEINAHWAEIQNTLKG